MNYTYSFTLLFAALLFCACNDRTIEELDLDLPSQYAYFPLETGKWIDYQVDSIVYDFGATATIRDSSTTYVRELIGAATTDAEGNTTYRVERLERKNANQDWTLMHIGTATRTDKGAFRTEGNNRFLRIPFPFDSRSAWDGNTFLDENQEVEIAGERIRPYTNWFYQVDAVNEPAMVGNYDFDNVLTITEADDINIIERRLVRTKYAQNIGLVEREMWILDSQYCNQEPVPADCETLPWEDKAEVGYILRQTVIDYN